MALCRHYNDEKTKCMCIKPPVTKYLYVTAFHLGHLKIKGAEKETYREYIIYIDMPEDAYIIKY